MLPVRILVIARSMRGGGAERFLTTLLRHINRDRFTPILCLIEKTGPFLSELPDDIEVIDLKAKRVRYALGKIVRLVRRKKPDVIFSTLGYLNLAVIIVRSLMPRGTKVVVRETNIPSIGIRQSPFPGLLSFLYRRFYKGADRVICQSCDMLDDLTSRFDFPPEKGVVINNPVDVKNVVNRSLAVKRVFPHGKVNILAVGKLMFQKGFDLLLNCMSQIKEPCYNLTILGQGPEETNLKAIVRNLGLNEQVTFAGFVENPYPYMVEADLFVLSSRFEGFPNVALEAMACGTPVVAFNVPGDIDEIIENGVNGWIVKSGDINAFSEKIKNMLAEPWDRDLIRRTVEGKFGVEKILAEYERVLLDVLNERRTKAL